ncbi:MAG: hypothetical protein JNL98_08415 [Bryobacterales bacterium]|nr:hypothetical protein [Bryobacterales bacterium]
MTGTILATLILTISTAAEITIKLDVYNTAEVPDTEMIAAERQVTALLKVSGFSVEWRNCPVAEYHVPSPCKEQRDAFIIGIRKSYAWGPERGRAIAFAMLFQGDRNRALVDYSRLTLCAEQMSAQPGLLLGYTIIHELGHLMLRTQSHGDGIMKSAWDRVDYRDMQSGQLRFTAKQSRRMQANLHRALVAQR